SGWQVSRGMGGNLQRFTQIRLLDGTTQSEAGLLRRVAELAHALPNQAVRDFDAMLENELDELPAALRGTEVERLVRQRVGQQAFRSAMQPNSDGRHRT
ncbi:MAG: hypothetical protein RQ757_01275, partial [Pseudomonadales bacterium]|nr:hypothetical protein [Pseudomonadales bacterium]